MFEIMANSEGKILGVRATSKLTNRDYREVFTPTLEELFQKYGKIRLLFYMDENFAGWEMGALWEDTKLDVKHKDDFEKVAVVGGPKWVRWFMKLISPLVSAEVKNFPQDQVAAAWEWLQA